jgi:mannose-6-phosphate isomerase-like protein (cupin superfamily)
MRTIETVIEGKEQPVLVPWAERNLNWRESTVPFVKPGWQGTSIGPTIQGVNFRFFPYYLPFGQARPFHIANNLEFVFFLLEGQMEIGVGPNPDQLRYFQLGKYDTLFIPRGMGVDYRNTGATDVRYVMANSHIGEWPKECIYYLPGEEKSFARKF